MYRKTKKGNGKMISTKGYLLLVPICLYFILTKNDWITLSNDPKLFSLYLIIYFLGTIIIALSDVFDKLKEINNNLSKGKEDDERK